MQVHYTVHSASVDPVSVELKMGDNDVQATVSGLTVELVSEGYSHHGHTFRLVPSSKEEMDAYQALFTVGAHVTATFSAGEAA